jgi:16S rRNA (uracil1498-N3)-methyltransferase
MQIFYAENYTPGLREITLPLSETRHLRKVLRKKKNDEIILTDGRGHHILGIIHHITEHYTQIYIQSYQEIRFPEENAIEVAIAVIKPRRMDWAVEKLTELGVKKIIPLKCQYNSPYPLKLDHLNKIAISAIKQSNQYYLPKISSLVDIKDWIQTAKGIKFIASFDESPNTFIQKQISSSELLQIMIGPEGGFHSSEIQLAYRHNFKSLYLGNTILRTETAAIVGVSNLKLYQKLIINK